MAHILNKILSIIIICLIFAISCTTFSSAKSTDEVMSSFSSADNTILCVAHRGDWHSFPENSAQAINAASDCDIICVDVQITSDSKVVLMADTTVDRMCTDQYGAAVSGEISSMSLEQLKALFLREGNGGKNNPKTDCEIATLDEALTAVGKSVLMINMTTDKIDPVLSEVKRLSAISNVIFRFDENNSTIIKTKTNDNSMPEVMGNYQGNIIFMATKAVNDCFKNSINTIELGSANGHGVLYDNFLMKRFSGKGRAMVSMVNGRCGKRKDNEEGWNDLISRGYSVIETDYPDELCQYIEEHDKAETELKRYVDLYYGTDTSSFTTDTENAFKSAQKNAEHLLSSTSSVSELKNARYYLQAAYNNLTIGAKKPVTLAFSFSFGRIAVAVLCATALIISQVLLYKKMKLRNKKNNTF